MKRVYSRINLFCSTLGLIEACTFLQGCAAKEQRVWIEPPSGLTGRVPEKKLEYQVQDLNNGKKETLTIPIDQFPEQLIVEDQRKKTESKGLPATIADQRLKNGQIENVDAKPVDKATLSYLKCLQEIEQLYSEEQFQEALIRIAPLLDEYPNQARLFIMQGSLLNRIGERRLALDSYIRAIEIDPKNRELSARIKSLKKELE